MKVIGINGSPNSNGNTSSMIKAVFSSLDAKDVDCELFQLGGSAVSGCINCGFCKSSAEIKCAIDDDKINACIEKMVEADAVIIGSPTYFSALTTETKALIDRAGRVCRSKGLLKRKIGAAVVPARRAGSMNVFQAINNFFLIQEMIIPGSTYWNVSLSAAPGDFEADTEGNKIMSDLGDNIAWLLNKIS
ncbi:MAG: flavodoxin family protein [Spirochaetales bacterium]|nr:flavodoxin family protein [Spirochaetales bacterium]